MAGPTPVSALIHAATMVTAGVYLIARSNVLFALAPVARARRSSLIGALTALFAATIGLKQWDIKKVLAYSTVSQLGYMFVGVGVGRVRRRRLPPDDARLLQGAAVPRLGLGDLRDARGVSRTHNHDDAQDMRNMGGLKKYMPITCGADVDRDARHRRHSAVRRLLLEGRDPRRGVRARAALDARRRALVRHSGQRVAATSCYVLGLAAAFMTAVYMTRMMLYTFHGPNRTGEKEREHLHEAPWIMTGPLVVLGVLSVVRRLAQHARSCCRSARSARSSTGSSRWSARATLRVTQAARSRRRTALEYALIGVAVADRARRYRARRARGSSPSASCRSAQAPRGAWLRARARSTSTTWTRSTTRRSSSRSSACRAACSGAASTGLIDGTRCVQTARARRHRPAAVVRLDRLAAPVGAGRHVRLGARRRRAVRARRLHLPLTTMRELSASDRLRPLDPARAARHPAARRGARAAARRGVG